MRQQFILVPKTGLRLQNGSVENSILESLPQTTSTESAVFTELTMLGGAHITVIDSIKGPKLVEIDSEVATSINNRDDIDIRALPLLTYSLPELNEPLSFLSFLEYSQFKDVDADAISLSIECLRSDNCEPIEGAKIFASSSSGNFSGITDSNGILKIRSNKILNIDKIWIITESTLWGGYFEKLTFDDSILHIKIDPVKLPYVDSISKYYSNSQFEREAGVVVGVIDTGVGPHPDLNISGGRNTVTGENGSHYDDWKGHGTHVAGIIGASGLSSSGIRGLAPQVAIRAYRVFGEGAKGATNYAIMKAMIMADEDGCDIINLSLGGGPPDIIVEEAILDARNRGMLVVIAAGNSGRRPVTFPAAYPGATAVSAMGVEGCFPKGSLCEGDIQRPPSPSVVSSEFIAGFSNLGPQVMCTGLGVGIISTLPNSRYGPSSGTSMAAPVVVGVVACLLSRKENIYNLPRTRARSDAIELLLKNSCVPRGFGTEYEGSGLPNPGISGGAWQNIS